MRIYQKEIEKCLLLIKFQKEHFQHLLRILMQKFKVAQVVWHPVFI